MSPILAFDWASARASVRIRDRVMVVVLRLAGTLTVHIKAEGEKLGGQRLVLVAELEQAHVLVEYLLDNILDHLLVVHLRPPRITVHIAIAGSWLVKGPTV